MRAVSQQDMRFINAARTIMKNMLNYFTETRHREERGESKEGEGGVQLGAESRSSVALLNLKSTVPTLFSHVLLVLQTCSMCASFGAWPAGSVARREREVRGVTRSGYATCAPLLRH